MENETEVKTAIKNILEMIYWLYKKELKDGNITKDNMVSSFGKILKKKDAVKKNDLPNLFNY